MADLTTDAERLRKLGREIFDQTRRTRSSDLLLIPVKDYSQFALEDMTFHDSIKRASEACGLKWLGDLQPISNPPREEQRPWTFIRVLASADGTLVLDAELVKPEVRLRFAQIESDRPLVARRSISVTTEYAPPYVLCTNNLLQHAFEHNRPGVRTVRMPKTTTVSELLARHQAEMEWLAGTEPSREVRPITTLDAYIEAVGRDWDAARRYHAANLYLGDDEVLFWLKRYDFLPGAKREILAGVAQARAAVLADMRGKEA